MNLSLPKRVNRLHQNGLTQRRIAEELGISQSQVRRYLKGYEGPQKKSRQESDILATARRLLREAKTEAERECVRNNFLDVLEEA